MKIKYFKDTDTLYIELRRDAVVETKDLDMGCGPQGCMLFHEKS